MMEEGTDQNISETVTIQAESGWHYSQGDAESECDNILDDKEDDEISRAESRGLEYVGGSTSGYDITHDSSADMFKCSAERTLNFIDSGDLVGEKKEDAFVHLSYEEYQEFLKDINGTPPTDPPIDVTGTLRNLIKPLVPSEIDYMDPIALTRRILPGGSSPRFQVIRRPIHVKLPLTNITFTTLNVVSSNLLLSEDVQTVNIPSAESVFHVPYSNCGSVSQRIIRNFDYKVVKGWKLEFTKKITSQTKIGGKLKFDVKFAGGEGSFERTLTTEITDSKTITETTEENVKTQFEFNIVANKIFDVTLVVRNFEARRSFKGSITLEGEIALEYGNGRKKVKQSLSSTLSEDKRTLNITGFYSNISWEEVPIKITEKDCPKQ